MKAGCPNIIVVKASNWTLLGYEHGRDLTSELEFEPIKAKVKEFLEEKNRSNISGIMIYERYFDKSRIILNRVISPYSRLSRKEKLMLFGRQRIAEFRATK